MASELLKLFALLIFKVQTLVPDKVGLVRKGRATEVTGKGFLSSMGSYMRCQAVLGVQSFATVVTLELPLSRVNQHMYLQATRGRKGTSALVTMKWPDSQVHCIDVFGESV